MQDELRSRLELAGMAIGSIPDSLESQMIDAAGQMSEKLLAEKKIIALGLGDGQPIAELFADEMFNSSQLDRPPLPCLLADGNASPERLTREIRALASPEDVLILFQNSQDSRPSGGKNEKLSVLYETINHIGLPAILVGHSYTYHLDDSSFINLTLDNESRMNYLCSITAVGLTLAALIDHRLFGHPV